MLVKRESYKKNNPIHRRKGKTETATEIGYKAHIFQESEV